MSRCVFFVAGGLLILLSQIDSRMLAAEISVTPGDTLPIISATLQPTNTEVFENHLLDLGSLNSGIAFSFGDDEPSPLFTGPSGGNPNGSDWDYLWRNASRIPITSIPEPTTGSLLIGGAVLLCLRRMRKSNE